MGTAQGAGSELTFKLSFPVPPLWKIIPACSAAEQSGNQSAMKSGFVKHRPRQPGVGRGPWVQVWSGPQP